MTLVFVQIDTNKPINQPENEFFSNRFVHEIMFIELDTAVVRSLPWGQKLEDPVKYVYKCTGSTTVPKIRKYKYVSSQRRLVNKRSFEEQMFTARGQHLPVAYATRARTVEYMAPEIYTGNRSSNTAKHQSLIDQLAFIVQGLAPIEYWYMRLVIHYV